MNLTDAKVGDLIESVFTDAGSVVWRVTHTQVPGPDGHLYARGLSSTSCNVAFQYGDAAWTHTLVTLSADPPRACAVLLSGPAVCVRCNLTNEYAEAVSGYVCYECR
jgi:hypothetical protein